MNHVKLWNVTVTLRDERRNARMLWVHNYAVLADNRETAKALGRDAVTFDLPEVEERVLSVRAQECDSPVVAASTYRITKTLHAIHEELFGEHANAQEAN